MNAQYNLGLVYVDLGDLDNAISWFRRAKLGHLDAQVSLAGLWQSLKDRA